MIKVELYLYNSAERGIFNDAMLNIEALRRAAQEAHHGEAAPGQRVPDVQVAASPEAIDEALNTAPVKKERKPRAKKSEEPTAAPTPAVDVQPEPSPAPVVEPAPAAVTPPPAPAPAPAAPKYTKQQLEDKVRALAKTNFVAVKTLLGEFSVARFGEMKEDQYAAFGDKLFALPEAPAAA